MIYKFSDLFKWTSGKSISPSDGNIPLYGSNGIIGYTNSAKYENKIILGRVGAYCGSVAYCSGKFNATDNTLITSCVENRILTLYAYYLLKSFNLNNFAGGAAQPLITQSILKRLKCDVPSLSQQHRIASILSTYDSLIENNTKRIRLLEKMAENLYKEWFVRFRFPGHENVEMEKGLPKGWSRGSLSEVCEFKRGKNITSSEMIEGLVPVISAGLEPSGFHNEANVKGVSVTMSSSGANAGYIAIHYSCIWAADCSYIEDSTTPYIYYVYELLNNIRGVISNFQRGAAQPHVYPKDINRIKMIIPSEDLRCLANERLSVIHMQIHNFEQQNTLLARQRDLLLPRLMSGKLEV